MFNIALFSSETVREEYRSRHNGEYPTVQINDVVFACHALIISSCTLIQSFIYKRDADQRVSTVNGSFIIAAVLVVLTSSSIAATTDHIHWLDLVYLLSYIKLYISFGKYVPQVLLNYRRQSTIGWSIINILLDIAGGTLSL